MILKPAALFAAFVALTFAGNAFAADPVNIQIMAVEEEPGSMILTVSAVDENGKPFPGLDPSSFNAWINDQALIVKELHTETDRQPASVLLLVDVSSSMAGDPIQQAKAAMNEFIGILEPNDQVAVMAFSDTVQQIQDFTTDRAALNAAVSGLALRDSTALYDGVIEASAKMAQVAEGRKLIVLLSDGIANINQGARDASIQAAHDGGAGFIAVGLGASTDSQYLSELATASGGSLIEAASPAELRAAYTGLAFAIRSQYTLVTEVPRSIDRTVPGTLKVHVIHRADNAFAERALEPLAGAVPPPFTMSVDGIAPGDKHNGAVELIPAVQQGIEVAKVDYILDDQVVYTAEGLGSYTLDASVLENGSHVIKIVATDTQGREGEVQVPFLVPVLVVPQEGGGLPILPFAILAVLIVLGYFGFKFGYKRWQVMNTPTYSRVDTWASIRTPSLSHKSGEGEEEPERRPRSPQPAAAAAEDAVTGRVVIMDEAAVRGGELETIREFEMKSLPLTFGSGPNADIRVGDAGGMIAAEEARVWVQRGRLVYHKLTTLSAMATEGVTAGWQFLDDGEEMRIGPYRIIFQLQQQEETEEAQEELPDRLPQEHGMALHRSFGLTETDRSPDLQEWVGEPDSTASRPNEPSVFSFARSVTPDDDAEEDSAASWESADEAGTVDSLEAAAAEWQLPPSAAGWDAIANGSQPGEDGELEEAASVWDVAGPTEWTIEDRSTASDDGEEASDPDEAAPDQESGWGSLTLEGQPADWLVEQSEPVDGGAQIVQPEAWSGFVSSAEDADAAAPEDGSQGEDEADEEHRAWGT